MRVRKATLELKKLGKQYRKPVLFITAPISVFEKIISCGDKSFRLCSYFLK